MSCPEALVQPLLGLLINQALDSGKELEAEFVPTDRNRIMAVTYSLMGFQIHEEKGWSTGHASYTAGSTGTPHPISIYR